MSLTRADLWGEVARQYGGHYIEGTATGGSTTTVADSSALPGFADDSLNTSWAAIITDAGGAHAAPEGQARAVSDFVASTGTLTVSQAFTAAVASGDTYRVWAGPALYALLEAVKSALRAAWPDWYAEVTDTTLTLANNTYEYTIPATIERLTAVYVDVGDYYKPVHDWRQMNSGATRTLVFQYANDYAVGDGLRLEGIGYLDSPANDYTAVTMRAEHEDGLREFVGYFGAAQLHRIAANRDREHYREHMTHASDLKADAERCRRRGMPPKPGRTRVVPPPYWS